MALRLGLGVGLTGGSQFSIASLYASGAQGLWTDLQGTPLLYTDTAGTTAATYGDSVARVNDRSGRGNHLTQATAGNRPVYARHPKTGIRNLLTYTEDFSNAAWGKANTGVGSFPTVTPNYGTAPDGTQTACRVQCALNGGTTTTDQSIFGQAATSSAASLGSWWVRTTDGSTKTAYFRGQLATSLIVTGTWTRVEFNAGTLSGNSFSLGLRGGQTPTNSDSVDLLVWHPQLEPGATATAYQKVTGWFDVTEAGVPSVPYLYFNGTSTSMSTSAIDFSAGDKMTVFAAVYRIGTSRAAFLELGNAPEANSFRIEAPDGTPTQMAFATGGSIIVTATRNGFTAPNNVIITGQGDIPGDSAKIRVNQVAGTPSTSDQGTGNYGNYPLYIGARAGTSLYFKGNLYDLAIVAAAQTDATIAAVENKLNSTVGAY